MVENSEKDVERRAEDALRRMLTTPKETKPKPPAKEDKPQNKGASGGGRRPTKE